MPNMRLTYPINQLPYSRYTLLTKKVVKNPGIKELLNIIIIIRRKIKKKRWFIEDKKKQNISIIESIIKQ